MVQVKENLIGQVFDRLTVVQRGDDYIQPSGTKRAMWWCRCSCGNENLVLVSGTHLKDGHTKSCGCLMCETSSKTCKRRKKENRYDLNGEYGIGYTFKGEEFWFDKEDYDLIKIFCWRYNSHGYVVASNMVDDPLSLGVKYVALHRLVMHVYHTEKDVDHKIHPDRNEHKVDNRKSNLRLVNDSLNAQNRTRRSDNTSGYTGVYYDKQNNKWVADICVKQNRIILGTFDNKDDAIQTRKSAEIKYFGDYRYDANN